VKCGIAGILQAAPGEAFFDTSVLVATFYGDHQDHDASIDRFLSFRRSEACCAAHSLAEVYSSLTRMPGKWRVSADQAMLFLATIRERLTIVALDADEYLQAIEDASALGITGGSIYDALLARCALKGKAQSIYTWNVRHFEVLGPSVVSRLKTP
jgi:predicted nucleic acid-binding protein